MADGTIHIDANVDTSGVDEGYAKIQGILRQIGDEADAERQRVAQILADVPEMDIDIKSNAPQTAADIDSLFARIDEIVGANREAVAELEKEYKRLGAEGGKAFQSGNDDEYRKITRQRDAVAALIETRKKVIKATEEEADKLAELEDSMKKANKAGKENGENGDELEKAHATLRQRIKEVREEMYNLALEGKTNTEEYANLRDELGELNDIMGDVAQQGRVLANDEAMTAGVIQGFRGMTAVLQGATGAMDMFGVSSETAAEITARLNTLAAISNSLQTIQQVINKDSAFSLVVLNGLKGMWAKMVAAARGEEILETAAVEANTVAEEANTAATAQNTASEGANTAANTANTAAQNANTASQARNTATQNTNSASTARNTAATVAQTGAATAGTAANFSLAGAFRALGVAIKSVPVFGWIIAGLTAIIGVTTHFYKKAKEEEEEAMERQRELTEVMAKAKASYHEAAVGISMYKQRIEVFKGSAAQEKELVEDLNRKYGESLGAHQTLAQWKDVLTRKGEAYCQMVMNEIEVEAKRQRVLEKYKELQEIEDNRKNGGYDGGLFGKDEDDYKKDKGKAQKGLDDATKDLSDAIKKNETHKITADLSLSVNTADARAAIDDQQKIARDASAKYIDAKTALDAYSEKIKNFNGTKREERAIVEELNQKYGSSLGYYDSMAQWQDVLSKKGEKYCEMMRKEVEVEGLRTLAREKFIKMQEEEAKLERGDYKDADGTNNETNFRAAEIDYEDAMKRLSEKVREVGDFKAEAGLELKFDTRDAEESRRKAIKEYEEKAVEWTRKAEENIAESNIEAQEDGMQKEVAKAKEATRKKLEAWEKDFLELAKAKKEEEKRIFLSKDGNTERDWERSAGGRKSEQEYAEELKKNEAVAKTYNAGIAQITAEGERDIAKIKKGYWEQGVKDYGTVLQRQQLLAEQWMKKINDMPEEFRADAYKKMKEEISAVATDAFKEAADWGSITEGMDGKSVAELRDNLSTVSAYFERMKESMTEAEKVELSGVIDSLQNAIADKNPFTAFANSVEGIEKAKNECVAAMNELVAAQTEFNTMHAEYLLALENQQEIEAAIREGGDTPEMKAQLAEAVEKTTTALNNQSRAEEKVVKSETKVAKARGGLSNAYTNFASKLKGVSGVISDLGGDAQSLAKVFSSTVADGIGKAIDTITAVIGAVSNVLDTIGNTSTKIVKVISSTAEGTAMAMTATSTTAAESIKSVERASVILAIIGAVLQVATAIANALSGNDDEEKQKEIDRLQGRIDQLQWELSNEGAMRLREKGISGMEALKEATAEAEQAVRGLGKAYGESNKSVFAGLNLSGREMDKMAATVQKLTDKWADLDYTSTKALGTEKYAKCRGEVENLAQQTVLLQKQIELERGKKDSNADKIQQMQQQIDANAAKVAEVWQEAMEGIVGMGAEDIASKLGNAFFDAVEQGEDAMKAWKQTTDDIVRDILKRMLIQGTLEQEAGRIMDKYQKKWFPDGKYIGEDAVIATMDKFQSDIMGMYEMGQTMGSAYKTAMDALGIDMDGGLNTEGRGIATASQESVDLNNARLASIQSHTFLLSEGMRDLNAVGNQILSRLTGIETNTDEANGILREMRAISKNIQSGVEDIHSKGIKMR